MPKRDMSSRFQVGDRSKESARQLWGKIPDVYQQHATFYTDLYDSYVGVIPEKQHVRVTKNTGLTNPIERFNSTMRQRISRLVRDSLAFSEKLDNHIGAIRYFICHYNQARNPVALLVKHYHRVSLLGSYSEFLWVPLLSPTFSLHTGQRLDFYQLSDYHASRTSRIGLFRPTKMTPFISSNNPPIYVNQIDRLLNRSRITDLVGCALQGEIQSCRLSCLNLGQFSHAAIAVGRHRKLI